MPNQLYSCIVLHKLLKYYRHKETESARYANIFYGLVSWIPGRPLVRGCTLHGFPAHVWLITKGPNGCYKLFNPILHQLEFQWKKKTIFTGNILYYFCGIMFGRNSSVSDNPSCGGRGICSREGLFVNICRIIRSWNFKLADYWYPPSAPSTIYHGQNAETSAS